MSNDDYLQLHQYQLYEHTFDNRLIVFQQDVGPDTEMFYDTGKPACSQECNPSCGCGKYVEIWNNVFMEFNKTIDGKFEPLKQKNVDTGMG